MMKLWTCIAFIATLPLINFAQSNEVRYTPQVQSQRYHPFIQLQGQNNLNPSFEKQSSHYMLRQVPASQTKRQTYEKYIIFSSNLDSSF